MTSSARIDPLHDPAATSINIRPGVGILGLFPAMNYKGWYALAELVDNALDSYIHNRLQLRRIEGKDFKLRIVIDVEAQDGGYIRVWDNAAGIDAKNYQRAFVTAEPPADSAGLSQFGIGMKSASCWFAREWRVRSTALGEPVERTVEFDVPKIIRTQQDSLNPVIAEALPEEHFTEVRLWNLYKPPQTQTVGKMRRHLASIYRQFLRADDVVIEFNGEPLTFEEPKVLVAPFFRTPDAEPREWKREVSFTLPTGESVSGFVGLREKGSTREAGLSLYRHDRLIVGSDDETYRPSQIFGGSNSYAWQRLFGELDMDDFQVTHTKDGFLWEDREELFLHELKKAIDAPPLPLLQQAEGYRARKAAADLAEAAKAAAKSTAAVLPEIAPTIESQRAAQPDAKPPAPSYGADITHSSKKLMLKIAGEAWVVSIDTTNDPAATEWVKIRDRPKKVGESREIGILFSVSHPFTQRYAGASPEQIEGLLRVAVGLAIAETTAREAGVQMAGVVTRNLNELLSGVLAQP